MPSVVLVAEQLEAIVDANSLERVLEALRNVCGDKQAHLRENWLGDPQEKAWGTMYRVLDRAYVEAAHKAV